MSMFKKKVISKKPTAPKFVPGQVVVYKTQSTPDKVKRMAEVLELPKDLIKKLSAEGRMLITTVKLVVGRGADGYGYIIVGPEDMEMAVSENSLQSFVEAFDD